MTTEDKKIVPSAYQTKVIDWVEHGEGSGVVIAVAGAGKTKTIELALPRIPQSNYVSIMAFNKTIADELKGRIEKLAKESGETYRNFRAMTFHSLGGGMVARRLGCTMKQLTIDDRKCSKIAEDRLTPDDHVMYAEFSVKLVGYAKGEGIGPLTPDTPDAWWKLVHHHDLTLESEDATEDRGIEIARKILAQSNKDAETRVIDYNDMLYLPLLWRLRPFQVDWVMVDEAQDTNPVRRALAKRCLKPGGRSMWVGDPRQAIYGFTGASADAIDVIKHEFNAIEMPLTVCYRCAKSVVEKAKSIVPYLEAWEEAPQGEVSHMAYDDALKLLDSHDAILCRNVAPLITTAFGLIAKGRACKVLGRDIGAGLVKLIKSMKAKNIDYLQAKLNAYREREVAKFMARGEEQKAEQVTDKVECIEVVIGNLGEGRERTIPFLIAKIEGLFAEGNGCLILASVHKAKGKEWPRVAILQPELMPSKWARQDWALVQEHNIRYVAWTRAQQHLIFMGDKVKGEDK